GPGGDLPRDPDDDLLLVGEVGVGRELWTDLGEPGRDLLGDVGDVGGGRRTELRAGVLGGGRKRGGHQEQHPDEQPDQAAGHRSSAGVPSTAARSTHSQRGPWAASVTVRISASATSSAVSRPPRGRAMRTSSRSSASPSTSPDPHSTTVTESSSELSRSRSSTSARDSSR